MVFENHILHDDRSDRFISVGNTLRPTVSPWLGISLVRFFRHCCVWDFRHSDLVFCPLDFQKNSLWGTLNNRGV
jgi:hypothetical protein